MKWFIARCPETYDDITGVFTSYSRSTLSSAGIRQAQELADVLRTIDEIWTGTSQAAIHASSIVADRKPLKPLRDLREVEMGKLEGKLPLVVERDYTQNCLQSAITSRIADETNARKGNADIGRQIRALMYLQRYDIRLMTANSTLSPFFAWSLCEAPIEIEERVQSVVQRARQMAPHARILTVTHPLLAAYLIERAKYGTTGQNIRRRCEKDGFFPLGFNEIAILNLAGNGRVKDTETFCVPYTEVHRYI